jgi:hypothetical protein
VRLGGETKEQTFPVKDRLIKSTTVNFTSSDLTLLDKLQKKLGLSMIAIIRLGIRKLADDNRIQ